MKTDASAAGVFNKPMRIGLMLLIEERKRIPSLSATHKNAPAERLRQCI